MPRRKKAPKKFRDYVQGDVLFPESIEEQIPEKHLVRVLNNIINRIDIEELLPSYKTGGSPSYHPKMMLKLVLYAYINRVYTGRQIAKQLRENICYQWLAGRNRPDFRSINMFRSVKLKNDITAIYEKILVMLHEAKYIKLENYFVDGTLIRANANENSILWKGSNEYYMKRVKEKVAEQIKTIYEIVDKENLEYGNKDLEELGEYAEITSDMLENLVKDINNITNPDKNIKKAVKSLEESKDKLKKYEEQEKTLGDRNSYSKTDPDASGMRMKEDRGLPEAKPKPAYNVQFGTEGQFITGVSVHQTGNDNLALKEHLLKMLEQNQGVLPERLIADAGYGSLQNYELLEEYGIDAVVKYNNFEDENKKTTEKNKFKYHRFKYDKDKDVFVCPNNKELYYDRTEIRQHNNAETRIYKCNECTECPFKSDCTKSDFRTVQFSPKLQKYKTEINNKMEDDFYKKLYKQRSTEVEPCFGNLKWNQQFRRFLLRGLKKVTVEATLLAIAHNIAHMFNLNNRLIPAI